MKTIWKYELQLIDTQTFDVPEGARFLCVQTQNEKPCMWFEVNHSPAIEQVTIAIKGTGHFIPDNVVMEYLGSCQIADGALVWHVYEVL